MLTLALLLATTSPTPATIAEGEAHRRALLAQVRTQLDAASVACHAARQATTTSPTSTADSCGAVLVGHHRLRALERAAQTKAARARTIRCTRPKGLTPPDNEGTALVRCLTSTYGKGALAPAVDADFSFIAVARTITGTGVILTDDDISFTLLDDDTDGLLIDVATAASTLVGVPPLITWPITAPAPIGSDRIVTDTNTADATLDVDTPVVGGVVVCSDRPKIMPLGGLVDVVMQAPGYHPEADPKRAVYRYAVPCPGAFVGASVGLNPGAFKPAPQTSDKPFRRGDCKDDRCSVVLANKKPLTLSLFVGGEGGFANVTRLGDINNDGVDDHLVQVSDASGGSVSLYLSKGGTHVVAGVGGWHS